MFPGLTGVPSAPSPGGNQGSRVTRHRVLGSRPGRSRQLRCPQVAGGQGGRISIQRPRLVSPAPSAPRGPARVRGSHNKKAPGGERAGPPRPAPPRLPASAPASPRESLPRHRLQVPGRGRGRGDNNPAGGRAGGGERRGAERQDSEGRGPGPCRRAIGRPRPCGRRSLVNAQIQSQGARGGVLAGTAVPGWSLAKAGRITLLPDGQTDGRTDAASWLAGLAGWSRGSASLARLCPCRQPASEISTHALPAHACGCGCPRRRKASIAQRQ